MTQCLAFFPSPEHQRITHGSNPQDGNCKKRRGKKEPPLWTVDQGLLLGGRSRAELPGVGEQGREGCLSARTCPDMPGHAQACLNTPDLALTFHPGLFDIGQGAPILSGYFLLNGGDEG